MSIFLQFTCQYCSYAPWQVYNIFHIRALLSRFDITEIGSSQFLFSNLSCFLTNFHLNQTKKFRSLDPLSITIKSIC